MLRHISQPLRGLVLCALAPAFQAQSALATVGQVVSDAQGSPLGTLAVVHAHAVTSGADFTVHGTLLGPPAGADEVLFGPSGVRLREGDPLPAPNASGATITGFGGIEQNAAGLLAYLVHGSAAGTDPAFEALYLEARLLLRTGTSAEAAGFGVGSTFADLVAFRLARSTSSCATRVLVRVDVATPTGLVEGLVEIESGCGAASLPVKIAAVGDTLCTAPACTVPTTAIVDLPESADAFAANAMGDRLFFARLAGGAAPVGVLAANGVLDAIDGGSTCGGADAWSTVEASVDLCDAGLRAVRGTLASGGSGIAVDACVARRTGDVLPGLPGPLTGLGRMRFAADGVLFWHGTFQDPSPNGGVGIFRDGTALVLRGVTAIGGVLVDQLLDAPGSFGSTGRSGLLAFQGTLQDGTSGVFSVPTTPPVVAWSLEPAPGCMGLNTASLTHVTGTSTLGDFFLLSLDQAQSFGALPQLFFANRPFGFPFDAATACGLPWIWGEVLLGLDPPNPVFGPVGLAWQPGTPPLLALGAPVDALNLIGQTWYVQGLFYDVQGTSVPNEPIRSTNALAVTFGSP